MMHVCKNTSSHWWVDWLSDKLFIPTTKLTLNLGIAATLWGKTTCEWWISTQRPGMQKAFSCHDVIINMVTLQTEAVEHFPDSKHLNVNQISVTESLVYSTIYSSIDQRKHQSSTSLVFVRGIHRWPVNSPHKWQVMWKMFPFDDIIMCIHIYITRSRRMHIMLS